ncbi:MAG: YidC/Oxa1 family insertase periplasmic-domain containing protein [Spirochaetales bacterium]|nr:YidC/Oxa1 family insertase periplasmic-domain containing protein [Spirochaetales bacterium]
MNKNTVFAFMLIFVTVAFFTSPLYQKFYYSTILKRPFPAEKLSNKKTSESKEIIVTEKEEETRVEDSTKERVSEIKEIPKSSDTIWIETEKVIAGVDKLGARIISLKMKEYPRSQRSEKLFEKSGKGIDYVEVISKESKGGACMTINNKNYDNDVFSCEDRKIDKHIHVNKGDSTCISFSTEDSSGNILKKKYLFRGDGYVIGLTVISKFLNNSRITLSWPAGIVESEKKTGIYQTEERAAHFSDDQVVEHIKANKPITEEKSGFYRWIGITSKYFFSAIVLDTTRDADIQIIAFDENKKTEKDGKKDKLKKINYSISYQFSVQGNYASYWFYTGPAKFLDLKKFKINFHKIMFPVYPWNILGVKIIPLWADSWFPPIAEFVLWLLLVLYGFTKDYGVSILLLTILTRLVTYPLTQSSMKSMSRMKELQPKINSLRQKYKSNSAKMNQEIMALYKKEGVNPLNPGCLPMLLQMPVFFALFVVLQKAIELRGASTLLVPWIHDLSLPESLISFEKVLPSGIPLYGSSFALLPVIMAVLTYFQNKMTIKDPNQKMMIYFMPIFMMVLFNNFPSGLVLYWTSSSALGLLQQYYTEKKRKKTTSQIKPEAFSSVK